LRIDSFAIAEIFLEKICKLLFEIFFDLKIGPTRENKFEKIALLILILNIRAIKKRNKLL